MRTGTVALSRDAGRRPLRDSVRVFALCLALAGCANYRPKPMHEVGFLHRAQTQSEGGLTVTAAVPSAEESAALFGVPLGDSGIPPVWVRVENRTARDSPQTIRRRRCDSCPIHTARQGWRLVSRSRTGRLCSGDSTPAPMIPWAVTPSTPV